MEVEHENDLELNKVFPSEMMMLCLHYCND